MPETYVALEEAASFEGVPYDTMKKRIERNPKNFEIKSEPQADGGKDRVLVAVSSLSRKARRAYKAAQKITGRDVIIEARTNKSPWYLDVDLNWYIGTHKRQYYEAVELSKRIQEFVGYNAGKRTAFAAQFAETLGISQRTLYRCAEEYLEASAWALQMEKDEGRSYDYFKVLSLCRKPKESHTFPSLTPAQKGDVKAPARQKRTDTGGNVKTQRQRRQIYMLTGELGWNDDNRRISGMARKMFKVDRLEWLSQTQCSKLIEALKKMVDRKEKGSR